MEPFTTIIISGGGNKGFAAIGALQALLDLQLINKVHTYIGTSVGAMISYLLCIGYSPIEIIISMSQTTLLEELSIFNLTNIIQGFGATRWGLIHEFLERLTIDKIGCIITLKLLHDKFNKTLICCTYNKTLKKTEYLDYINNPDLPCLTALRMSSNLPFIFNRFKYRDCYYIDGGITDNLPFQEIKGKTLAIHLMVADSSKKDANFKLLNYIYEIVCIPIQENMQYKKTNIASNCTLLEIDIDLEVFKFNISNKDRLEIFSVGYQTCKNFLNHLK